MRRIMPLNTTELHEDAPRQCRLRHLWPLYGIVGVLLVTFVAGLLVPVYSDEIATKLLRGMLLANGGHMNTLMPQCDPAYLHSVPWTLLPGAWFYEWVLFASSPMQMRVTGIVIAIGTFALLAFALHRQIASPTGRAVALALMASIVGLGVMPLTLVMARADQLLVFMLTFFLCFPVIASGRMSEGAADRIRSILRVALFALAVSFFLYLHQKALFFVPVMLVSAYAGLRASGRKVVALAAVWVLICAAQSYVLSVDLVRCAGAPRFAALMSGQTTPPALLFSAPVQFMTEVLQNVVSAPEGIAKHAKFAEGYSSSWIAATPGITALPAVVLINSAIEGVLTIILMGAVCLPPLLLIWRGIRRTFDTRMLYLGAYWVGLMGHLALFRHWGFYAGALVAYLAGLLLVLCAASFRPGRVKPLWLAMAGIPCFAVYLASAAVLFTLVVPRIAPAVFSTKDGISGQPTSVPTFGFPSQRERIRAFANQCGIRGDGATALVVDDLTFFAFDHLRAPVHSDYLYDQGYGIDLVPDNGLPKLLRKIGANQLIAQCNLISGSLKPWVRREGNLCCLDLSSVPSP